MFGSCAGDGSGARFPNPVRSKGSEFFSNYFVVLLSLFFSQSKEFRRFSNNVPTLISKDLVPRQGSHRVRVRGSLDY